MNAKETIKKWVGENPVIVILKKLGEYGTIVFVVWAFVLPAFEDKIQDEIHAHEQEIKEKEDAKVPFRELLGQEMGVQSDRVHIYMGVIAKSTMAATDSIEKFSEKWVPYLEEELANIEPRLIIIDGDEYWLADDNELYRVTRNEEGFGFFYRDGAWEQIFN